MHTDDSHKPMVHSGLILERGQQSSNINLCNYDVNYSGMYLLYEYN